MDTELLKEITHWKHILVAALLAGALATTMLIVAEGVAGHAKRIDVNKAEIAKLHDQLSRMETMLAAHLEDCSRRHHERGY